MSFELRLDRIESRGAILDLVAAYCHGADGRDEQLFCSVWHDDAVWQAAPHRFVGLDEIVAAVARQWDAFTSMHHSTSNSVVQFVSDDEASGRHDVLTLTVFHDGRTLLSTGQYLDRYTRRNGRWAFAERSASVTTTVELTGANAEAP